MRPNDVNQAGPTVVVADPERLTHARRNAALGNKICHLLFLISLCERNDAITKFLGWGPNIIQSNQIFSARV